MTAGLASACCWLPLMLVSFGVSVGGLSAGFERVRPFFLGVTAVLLGAAFYFVYFRKEKCAPGAACAVPNPKLKRFNRGMLWFATVAAVAFGSFPNYAGLLADGTASALTVVDEVSTVTLGVEGMSCEACTVHVRKALAQVPGVKSASVNYDEAQAVVSVDADSPPAKDALIEAVEKAGYKAQVQGN